MNKILQRLYMRVRGTRERPTSEAELKMSILEEKQRALELSLMTLESEIKAQRAQQGKTVAYILRRNEDFYAKVEAQEQAMENLVETL